MQEGKLAGPPGELAHVLRPFLRQSHPPGVGGHDHEVVVDQLRKVVGQQRQCGEVVEGNVEEALDLPGVEIDRQHSIHSCDLVEVRHKARRDRLAPEGLLVLAGVGIERDHRRDALGGSPTQSVDHDQVLHEVDVDRIARTLDHEGVLAPHRLRKANVGLGVGVGRDLDFAELHAEMGGDLLCEPVVGGSAEEHQPLVGGNLHSRLPASTTAIYCHRSSGSAGRALRLILSPRPRSRRAGAPTARASSGTSLVTTDPAPVAARAPRVTGATSMVSDPM
jgi:hypothetical protein